MCGIYASENYIPHNRPDVYEKCALLLFDRWDKQRGIVSPMAFDAHVQAAMRSLALWLYPQQDAQEGISRSRLIQYMTTYLRAKRFDNDEEAEDAAIQFIDFCKGRAWVLTDVGAEKYAFTHRTFLEYFAASQLVRLHPSANALFETLRPHIVKVEWDVLAQLAVQTLGKTVEDGADDFLELILRSLSEVTRLESINLLSFAARSLTFIVPRPSVLKELTSATIAMIFENALRERGPREFSRPLGELLAATSENLPLIEKYMHENVIDRLSSGPEQEDALKLGLNLQDYIWRGSDAARGFNNIEYWRAVSKRNRKEFRELVPPYADRFWVANLMLDDGSLSLDAFVNQFGIAGLYRENSIGNARHLGLWALFRRAALNDDRMPDWLTPEVCNRVIDWLLAADVPWLSSDIDLRPIHFAPGLFRPGPKADIAVLSASMLLLLPVAEVTAKGSFGPERTESAFTRRMRRNLLGDLAELDDERGDVGPVASGTLQPRVEAYIGRWIAGGIDLVGYGGRRRR
jgi:hypothetical protein